MFWWIPLIGAAIGALAYEDDPWTGALIGAGIGMTGGAAAGAMGAGAATGAAATGTAVGTGAGLTASTGAGLTMAGAAGAGATGTGLTAATGAGLGLYGGTAAAGGMGLVAPAASATGYGLLGAGTAGAGFMTQAKPWLDAGTSIVQQSGLLNQQPQRGPQHLPLPRYDGNGMAEIGKAIQNQGGDLLQANALARERNKQQRAMMNPFAYKG